MASLGHDLASLRRQKNITLEEVHAASKIPLDILRAIENDSIFNDPRQNPTYVRSFVRSYAKILKIEENRVLAALDAVEQDKYEGELLSGSPPAHRQSEPKSNAEKDPLSAPTYQAEIKHSNYQNTPDPPTINTVNWADLGKKFIITDNKPKFWIIVVSVVVVLGVLSTFFILGRNYLPFLNMETAPGDSLISDTQPPAVPPVTPDLENQLPEDTTEVIPGSSLSENSDQPAENRPAQSLDDTLSLIVYAAYDKLEPVRVTSDLNWRTNPFWMEPGEAYYFDFEDTVLVRGQYDRMLLLLNGHLIENFRQNYFNPSFNSVMLTRSIFENNPVYTRPAPQEFPLSVGPPDSVTYPPVF